MTLRTITCAECARMIVRADGETSYPLCATCLSRPGWIKDPLMRWLFGSPAEATPEAKVRPSARYVAMPEEGAPRQRRRFGLIATLAALMWSGVIGAVLAQFIGGSS